MWTNRSVPVNGPDPAHGPVDRLRQQARQADAVRRLQQRRQPLQAGHLGVVRDRRDLDEPHERQHQAPGALSGGDGLRQQARPAPALGRLRARASRNDLWSWSPTTPQLDDRSPITGTRAGQRRERPMFYDAARDKVDALDVNYYTDLGVRSRDEHLDEPVRLDDAAPPAFTQRARTWRSPSTPTAASCCSSAATARSAAGRPPSTTPTSGSGTRRRTPSPSGSPAATGTNPGRPLPARRLVRLRPPRRW